MPYNAACSVIASLLGFFQMDGYLPATVHNPSPTPSALSQAIPIGTRELLCEEETHGSCLRKAEDAFASWKYYWNLKGLPGDVAGLSDLLQVCLSWGYSLKSRLVLGNRVWAPQPPHLPAWEPRDTIWGAKRALCGWGNPCSGAS